MDLILVHGIQKVVAGILGVSVRTIENHAISVKRKMNARGRTEAIVRWALWRQRTGKLPEGVKVE